MITKRTMEWVLSCGKASRLEGTYVSMMVPISGTNEEDITNPGPNEESHTGSELNAYVGGVLVDWQKNPKYWNLVDGGEGRMKIRGLSIGFPNAEAAKPYLQFLHELMQEDPDVLKYQAEKKRRNDIEELKRCRFIVEQCENGYLVETQKEADDNWNNSSTGYIPGVGYPEWYTRAEYESCLAFIREHRELEAEIKPGDVWEKPSRWDG